MLSLHIRSLSKIMMVDVLVVSPAEVASTVNNSNVSSTVVSSKIVMFTHWGPATLELNMNSRLKAT